MKLGLLTKQGLGSMAMGLLKLMAPVVITSSNDGHCLAIEWFGSEY